MQNLKQMLAPGAPTAKPHDMAFKTGIGFVVFAVGAAFLIVGPMLKWRMLALDGVVESSVTECQQPQNNRCVSTYVLRTPANESVTHETSDPRNGLPLNLPVGTAIAKRAGESSYRIDDRLVDRSLGMGDLLVLGFPVVVLAFGLGLLLWSRRLKSAG